MSIWSTLEVRRCPRCDRDIVATSNRCQFCGAEVAPTAAVQTIGDTPQPVLSGSRQTRTWLEVANTILGVIWIIGGVFGLLTTLMVGGFGPVLMIGNICVIFLGLGVVRQQWFAMMIARFACIGMGIYASYMLIAIAAVRDMPNDLSLPYALFMLVLASFQGYVFWSISD